MYILLESSIILSTLKQIFSYLKFYLSCYIENFLDTETLIRVPLRHHNKGC